MGARTAPDQTVQGVLAVLAGTPLRQAAADIGMDPTDLADAAEVYRTAGHAALEAQADTHGWYQVRVQFADWDAAEHVAATRLAPELRQAQNAGVLAGWWFIRKAPYWRLRCQTGPAVTAADLRVAMCTVLDGLTGAGLVGRWWETVYEPEVCAFGGPEGMAVAHDLFHADSVGVLDYMRRQDPASPAEGIIGRRELSVVLCSALFRRAGQEWHEQGDVWHRVAQMRPLPPKMPTDRLSDMAADLQRLLAVDAGPTSALFGTGGPLAFAAPWAVAFDEAGRGLATAAREGTLQRGVRDVLAHHVIFHWNRLGLAARTQGILAWAACDTVMNPPGSVPALESRRADVGGA